MGARKTSISDPEVRIFAHGVAWEAKAIELRGRGVDDLNAKMLEMSFNVETNGHTHLESACRMFVRLVIGHWRLTLLVRKSSWYIQRNTI